VRIKVNERSECSFSFFWWDCLFLLFGKGRKCEMICFFHFHTIHAIPKTKDNSSLFCFFI
jgi:hypothetical protein